MVEIVEGLVVAIQKNKLLKDELFCIRADAQGLWLNCNVYYLELNLYYSSYNFDINLSNTYLNRYTDLNLVSVNFRTIYDVKARNILHAIMNCNTELPTYSMQIHSLILKLVDHLYALAIAPSAEESMDLSSSQIALAERVKEYLDSRIKNKILLEDLAKSVGTNKTYAQRWFKIKYGLTIHEYHIKEKMHTALNMLQNKNNTLQHIALALGYSNLSNFSNAFKKQFGKYPSSYFKI